MTLHDQSRRDFDSDNCAGVHPEVFRALADANEGHQPSYGNDSYTSRLQEVVRDTFGETAVAYPVFNGTGANVLALQSMTRRGEGAVCATSAHLNTRECAAPEHHGVKLIAAPAEHGRLTVEALKAVVDESRNRHQAQPGVVSLTQSTELGTCYSPFELSELARESHRQGLPVHLDGARLTNAAASLGVSLRALSTDVGVDVLSLGTTKCGGMFGECLVVLDPTAVSGLPTLLKATTQLASKARFISAQVLAVLENDLWLRTSSHANAMAQRLHRGLVSLPGVDVVQSVDVNAVFVAVPEGVASKLAKRWLFHVWDAKGSVLRLMTAFDTQPSDVDALVRDVAAALESVCESP